MIRLIQFLKGYVVIHVSGYSPERFMNLCCNHNILLWDIKNCGEYYRMYISIRGYFKLKGIVRKTGTKVVIEQKCGLPFFVPKIKKRSIFGIGFILCFLFLLLMSRYIWTIDIEGNQTITEDVFLDFLAEYGIKSGMKKKDIDMEQLEHTIREKYQVVTWTSGRIEGTRLTIQLRENAYLDIVDQEPEDSLEGTDIVADKDGTVVGMITRKGVPQVGIGDEITAGQILVSGQIPIYNEDTTVREMKYCRSDADISLRCTYRMRERLPVYYQQKEYTGESRTRLFIQVLDKEIPLGPGAGGYLKKDTVIEKRQLRMLQNFYFPFYYGKVQDREYVMVERKYEITQAKEILSKRFQKNLESLAQKGVQILEKNVKIEKNGKEYILNAEVTVVELTGKPEPTARETPIEEESADE